MMGTDSLSSNRYLAFLGALVAGVILGRITLSAQQPSLNSASFTCPATVTVAETAVANAPWRAEAGKTEHKFSRPSIYNGTPEKQEFELAPHGEQTAGRLIRQDWKLVDYRDMNLFVRCRYDGTVVTLVTDLPKALKNCSFSFQNVAGKPPVSPAFECK
jgi:hypothetical protein